MALEEYRSKRDFAKTKEPAGYESTLGSIFVVQEHHATHLHYDFRFELEGVLRSWAVPKGVPEEPKVKKLAVQTEDHPLEYADFEGEIPQGEYGGGQVRIWDRGSCKVLEQSADKYVVDLQGARLKGKYALVRFKGKEQKAKNWLIMKL